ncbi:YdeI/OmpD-associated family protein [Chryseobacterium sp.]|uniref:YdeI/OmpD-associated family protein n=1 Tax=Chryseobacterium sp. TaxID=1871047 RepID=UPI0025C28448|nr:YdeI/OmpD-associated family protein [Chryseobacterium sp.]
MEIHYFTAKLEIIGINPFVFVPEKTLDMIFKASGKNKGAIQVKGTVNGVEYTQNLVRYAGEWRLYVNLTMLKNSPKRIGELIEITIEYDVSDRSIPLHPQLEAAIKGDPEAYGNFEGLTPSRKKEVIRYINNLKTGESVQRNILKIMAYLKGETDFFGNRIQ